VNINVGGYVHFGDVYKGEIGNLECDYWVLRYNEKKAKEHFKQAHLLLKLMALALPTNPAPRTTTRFII